MKLSILPLGVYAGILVLAGGAVYEYLIKRHKLDIGHVMQLIVYSYLVGTGLLLMLKGLSFALLGWSILSDMSSGDIRGIVFIGSTCGICLIFYFFVRFLRRKDFDKND